METFEDEPLLMVGAKTSTIYRQVPQKKKKGGYFLMMTLAMATELAKKEGLQGNDLRVLLIMFGKMEFGRDVRVSQGYIAEELGINRTQVTTSVKHLIDAGVITRTMIDGMPAYRINVATMGKGVEKNQ